MTTRYVATVGINYADSHGAEVRVEAGEEVPAAEIRVARWLLDKGYVRQEAVADPPVAEEPAGTGMEVEQP